MNNTRLTYISGLVLAGVLALGGCGIDTSDVK